MELLEWMARGGHDRVLAVQDELSGLRAWLALHNLRRGPAYGGIRVWRYRDEAEAALDALRLSRAMTFKCVLAGIQGGGAKTVVLADRLLDRPAAMAALGRTVESLGGIYRCGPDVGFSDADRAALGRETRWLAHDSGGGLRPAGEATSEGAIWGIKAALSHHRGEGNLEQVTIAVQGLGSVGLPLSRRLIDAGATVIGADPDAAACERAREIGVRIVEPGRIYECEADIFAPCALGGTLHDLTIQRLSAPIVAGCANNVLARPEHAQLLRDRGTTFIPDFVLNAGALIEGAGYERTGRSDWSEELSRIHDTVLEVLRRADEDGMTTVEAAVARAKEILDEEDAQARQAPAVAGSAGS